MSEFCRGFICAITLLVACGLAQEPRRAPKVFIDHHLGFVFVPPSDMYDLTEIDRQAVQARAQKLGSTNTLNLLLSLRSGPDDTSSDWHSVGIETCPRVRLTEKSDEDALDHYSRRIATPGTPVGVPEIVEIQHTRFHVLRFEFHEAKLTKTARVYSAVIGDQALAIAFSANSDDVLNAVILSMQTFQVRSPK